MEYSIQFATISAVAYVNVRDLTHAAARNRLVERDGRPVVATPKLHHYVTETVRPTWQVMFVKKRSKRVDSRNGIGTFGMKAIGIYCH